MWGIWCKELHGFISGYYHIEDTDENFPTVSNEPSSYLYYTQKEAEENMKEFDSILAYPGEYGLHVFNLNKKFELCGFLSPDGEFYQCRYMQHIQTAHSICEYYYKEEFEKFVKQRFLDGFVSISALESEMFLIAEKGFVAFKIDSCTFNDSEHTITKKQCKFMNEHLKDAEPIQKYKMEMFIRQYLHEIGNI